MSRTPKNFEEALEKANVDAPAVEEKAKDAFGELEREFRKIWSSLQGMGAKVGPNAAQLTEDATDRVAQSPWVSIGLVGVVAFVIGYLMGGRKSE